MAVSLASSGFMPELVFLMQNRLDPADILHYPPTLVHSLHHRPALVLLFALSARGRPASPESLEVEFCNLLPLAAEKLSDSILQRLKRHGDE